MASNLTPDEKFYFKGNVEFFLERLSFFTSGSDTKNVNLEMNPDLTVKLLTINSVDDKIIDEVKECINSSLISMFSSFEEFKAGSVNKTQLAVVLEITFMDYIEYVMKKNENN
jgi:hypothetical protein